MKSRFTKSLIFVFILLIIDQVIKVWIKTNMTLGQEFNVIGDWFLIHFIENPGMALGMQIGGDYGKLLLSLIRIIAIIVIIGYLYYLSKKKSPTVTLVAVSVILAGAIGNILDSAFYGIIFSESTIMQVATAFPETGGYSSFLHGSVVDMFYFPLFDGFYPTWFPYLGGSHFEFFRPVFNFADSAVTVGVILVIIFRKKFIVDEPKKEEATNEFIENNDTIV